MAQLRPKAAGVTADRRLDASLAPPEVFGGFRHPTADQQSPADHASLDPISMRHISVWPRDAGWEGNCPTATPAKAQRRKGTCPTPAKKHQLRPDLANIWPREPTLGPTSVPDANFDREISPKMPCL